MERWKSQTTRRRFLTTSVGAVATAPLLSGARPVEAEAKATTGSGAYVERARVDLHCHYVPDFYRALLGQYDLLDPVGIPVPTWTPKGALQFMGQHGIAVQMLSISDPGVQFVPVAQQAALASRCNDYVKTVVDAHPGRFGAVGVLPLDDPDAAVAEAIRCLDVLKLDGIGMLSHSLGRYPGDPAFEPLLAELDRRHAWVFVHPTHVGQTTPDDSAPVFVAEFPFDTTRAFMSLLFNDCFGRHRRIRFQFAHGGGFVPMLDGRLSEITAAAKQYGTLLGLPKAAGALNAHSVTDNLRRQYYDTALIGGDPIALGVVRAASDVDHIVFGTDWPFSAVTFSPKVRDPAPALSRVFSDKQRHQIERVTAREQFPRLRAAVPLTPEDRNG